MFIWTYIRLNGDCSRQLAVGGSEGKRYPRVLQPRECSFEEPESEFRKLQLIKRTECAAIYPPPRLLP